MQFKQLLTDEDAVSPVIGVILMVAITVILAAVIGTFVLGLGGNVSSAPQAQISFDYQSSSPQITVTHDGGDSLDESNFDVQVNGNSDSVSSWASGDSVTAGDSFTVDDGSGSANVALSSWSPAEGHEVQIIWQSPEGGNSNVIATGTYQT
jgi:flagellin-like protein